MIEKAVERGIKSAQAAPPRQVLTPHDHALIESAITTAISSKAIRDARLKLISGVLLCAALVYVWFGILQERPAVHFSARTEGLQLLSSLSLGSVSGSGIFDMRIDTDRVEVLSPYASQLLLSDKRQRHRVRFMLALPIRTSRCPAVAFRMGISRSNCSSGVLPWNDGFAVESSRGELRAIAIAAGANQEPRAYAKQFRMEPHPEGLVMAMDVVPSKDSMLQFDCGSGKLRLEPAGRSSIVLPACDGGLSARKALKIQITYQPTAGPRANGTACFCPMVLRDARQLDVTSTGSWVQFIARDVPVLVGNSTLLRLGPVAEKVIATGSGPKSINLKAGHTDGREFVEITSPGVRSLRIDGDEHVSSNRKRYVDLILAVWFPLLLVGVGWTAKGVLDLGGFRWGWRKIDSGARAFRGRLL